MSTYRIEFGEPFLHAEEVFNALDQSVRYEIFDKGFESIVKRKFDADGNLVVERHLEGDTELTRTEFMYDDQQRGAGQKMYISGELYEQTVIEYTTDGYIKTTLQDGKEVERLVKKYNGKSFKSEFFENGHLDEIQINDFDEAAKQEVFESRDGKGQLLTRIISSFHPDGSTRKQLTFNEEEHLVSEFEFEFEFDQDLLLREYRKDEHSHFSLITRTNVYDEHENMIKSESTNEKGEVIASETYAFDEYNRLIEHRNFSLHGANLDYGTLNVGNDVHLTYQYESIDSEAL